MLEKTTAFKTSDGQTFEELSEAQQQEIILLLPENQRESPIDPQEFASLVVTKSEQVIDILTTTPTSLLKARKTRGGTKKRAAKSDLAIPA